METGRRRDAKGEIVPQYCIQNIVVTHNGNTVYSGQWSQAVPRSPEQIARVVACLIDPQSPVNRK